MAEAPKFIVVGDEELTQTDADELIGIFNMPGWRVLARIVKHHKDVAAQNLLGKAVQRTLQDLGIAQGAWGTCDGLLNMPEEASLEYENFRTSDETA